MTERICHLCETSYNDDPYFAEQPAHTPQQCLEILRYRLNHTEVELSQIKEQLARAEKEYHLKVSEEG